VRGLWERRKLLAVRRAPDEAPVPPLRKHRSPLPQVLLLVWSVSRKAVWMKRTRRPVKAAVRYVAANNRHCC
jgi:hypothetical protein